MKGPTPKPPALRQRMNKASTRATLVEGGRRAVPPLPAGRDWRPETRYWWREVWRSPMAAEYLPADRPALHLLADMIDRYWAKPDTKLATEIRQQSTQFGLTPMDRRRLQWEVKRAEGTAPKAPAAPPPPADDPRKLLQVV